jgi:hypothetical protein
MKTKYLIVSLFFVLLISGFAYYNANKTGPAKNFLMDYKGMNLVAPIRELKNSNLEDLKNNHVNAISLIPYAFVNIDDASIHYNDNRQWWGERAEGIRASAKMAHEFKMRVMLKPHLWVNHNFYTGDLDFTSEIEWKHWEADYEKYILDFAKLAQEEHITLFCFGTELGNAVAKRPAFWNQLILKIKTIYKGKLTYAANWDDFDTVPFWNQLDYIGIDAYFPLSNEEKPTTESLKEGWEKHIKKMDGVQHKFNKKILFTEFGYRNSNHAGEAPWTETNTVINNVAQTNAYEALFQVLTHQPWFAGGFAWKWFTDDYHKRAKNNIDYTPQGKPALETIKKWYH